MSEACDQQLLEAYLDGELDAAGRARAQAHLAECAVCSAELETLRRMSQMIAAYPFEDITEAELKAVHEAIDDLQETRVWRIGGTLGLVAASILIVSLAWLNAMPAAPARLRAQKTVSAPAWQQVAMTLRAGPLPASSFDHQQIQLANAQTADPQLADWMLDGLSAGGRQMP